MHKGTFPKPTPQTTESVYERGAWSSEQLDGEAKYSRRQWMFGVCGIALSGVAAGAVLSQGWIAGAASASAPPSTVPATPDTPEWALALLDQPAEKLIQYSGNLERISARYRTDSRLVPCFERLLDVVLESRGEYVDMAGAIAVRSLKRMGRVDSVAVRERRIRDRSDLIETRQTAQWVLDDRETGESRDK